MNLWYSKVLLNSHETVHRDSFDLNFDEKKLDFIVSQKSSERIEKNLKKLKNLQIQWLINNYEPADGTSLPRCTLYSHYIKFVVL